MPVGIPELALTISVAAVFSLAARLLRQSLILAYLAAGFVLGAIGVLHGDRAIYEIFSNLGVMFLLFLIGLEIDYASLRLVGRVGLVGGAAQILITFFAGWLLVSVLGWSALPAAYVALALTFSSTVIVVKLLSEKRDLNSLYGKVSVAFLLLQDFVAIMILVVLSGIDQGQRVSVSDLLLTVGQGIVLFGVMLVLGRTLIPLVLDRIARSLELLFLISLAWVFVVAWGASRLGFSIEIGGFLAGIALANSSEHFQIASRIKPLRDFFLILFFVLLGSSVGLASLSGLVWPVLLLSLFVLIVTPVIIMMILGAMGYHRRTSFMTGITVAQISEFSLVLAALGFKVGHLDSRTVGLITAVGVITIAVSSYLIMHAERLYRWLGPWLTMFERPQPKADRRSVGRTSKRVVLVGAHRVGQSIAQYLPKRDLLIIDFDPDIVKAMRRRQYSTYFGDAADSGFWEELNLRRTEYILALSPDLDDTLSLLANVRHHRTRLKRCRIIARAESDRDAQTLYAAGADYVLMPHLTSGQYLGQILARRGTVGRLAAMRQRDLRFLAP